MIYTLWVWVCVSCKTLAEAGRYCVWLCSDDDEECMRWKSVYTNNGVDDMNGERCRSNKGWGGRGPEGRETRNTPYSLLISLILLFERCDV